RGALALSDRQRRERGRLLARVRAPRPAPLRDQGARAGPEPALHLRAPRAERARPQAPGRRAHQAHRARMPRGRAGDRRRRLQRLAQPRRQAPRGRARAARSAHGPVRPRRAQLPVRVPAAAPRPHLPARLPRQPYRGAPRPAVVADLGPRTGIGPPAARMSYALVPGNRITLLRSGVEYFPALEAAIRAARREIYLESYLYEADETGWRITNALADAARRGVAVHVLVDGFGAKAMPPEMVQALARAGGVRLVYRPEISPFRIRKYRLRRMHRKLVAIDGAVACVGGINVIDDFGPDGRGPPRLDFAVRIEGPLLRPIQEALQRL